MPKDVTRKIKPEVVRELWARAAGRCEFNGCNRIVYKTAVTQERVNISEQAHIYSFSENGPRGWGPFTKNTKELNSISNLMLMCHDCHKTIDQDIKGEHYSAKLLLDWKTQHEQRVELVTGICPNKRSHVIIYGAKIGEEKAPLQFCDAVEAMFPDWYPAEERAITLSMSCEHEDKNEEYWKTESANLKKAYERFAVPRIDENNPCHFSVFALAPQPLLIQLGTLLTDKIPVEVYQLHREPKTWKWQEYLSNFNFTINRPKSFQYPPALIISLSDKISKERIWSVIGEEISIWELTIENYHNDFLKSKAQLAVFRETIRKLMIMIKEKHGQTTPLNIFPAMPVSCAVEFGRARMPKADMPWIIYDQNNKLGKFIRTFVIGSEEYESISEERNLKISS